MKADRAVLEIARRLHETVDVAVLTNNTTLVADHIDTLLPELRPLFGSRIYTSAQFKAAKPDPRCYRLCQSELQRTPQTVLFVDDLAANVAGAREAGLSAHHHTSVEAFRQALSAHGLLKGRMNGRTASRDVRRGGTPPSARRPPSFSSGSLAAAARLRDRAAGVEVAAATAAGSGSARRPAA